MIKKYSLVLIAFLYSFFYGFAQTTLSSGDIAITGFNSSNPDQFTFVLLTDVAATTQIKFTDKGWLTSGSIRSNEGTLIWNASTVISCGTEITVTDNAPFNASIGSITDSSGFALSSSYIAKVELSNGIVITKKSVKRK